MKKFLFAFFALFFSVTGMLVAQAEIQVSSYKTASQRLPKNAVRASFLKIKIAAVDQDAWISGFRVSRQGLSSFSDFGRIWAESQNDFKTFKRKLNSDDFVELSFRRAIKIPKGRSQIFQIYANLNVEGSGKTLSLVLDSVLTPSFVQETAQEEEKPAEVTPKRKSKIYCKNRKCYRR